MATLSSVQLTIVRDVANANITVDYTITWSAFDQLTNLPYRPTFALRGDDTGQDGDNGVAGDDPISLGLVLLTNVSSNGQASSSHTRGFTIPFSSLNEDFGFANAADNDDEIRMIVTLTPQLPVAVSRESDLEVVTSP